MFFNVKLLNNIIGFEILTDFSDIVLNIFMLNDQSFFFSKNDLLVKIKISVGDDKDMRMYT